jgi:hypothetical protein
VLFSIGLQLVQRQQDDDLCFGKHGRRSNLQDQLYNLLVTVLVMIYGRNVVDVKPSRLLHQTALLWQYVVPTGSATLGNITLDNITLGNITLGNITLGNIILGIGTFCEVVVG